MLARRSVVGSSPSASDRATFSEPIAPAAAFALPTSAERSSRRPASVELSRPVSTMKRVRAASSSVSSPTSRREVDSSGLKYSAAMPASASLPSYWVGEALDDVLERAARLRVERVEDLVEVDDRRRRVRGEHRAVVELGRVAGSHGQGDVAVGDARQRRQPDRRLGALAQRREGLLDLHGHRGLVVVGELDVGDRAHAAAADLDVVVAHELARVLEHERVLVTGAAAEEQQPGEDRDGQDQREGGESAAEAHSIPSGPCEAPARNWRTNWLSELNSSSAGPDSTIRPFQSTAMYSATRLADMMSWVMTT